MFRSRQAIADRILGKHGPITTGHGHVIRVGSLLRCAWISIKHFEQGFVCLIIEMMNFISIREEVCDSLNPVKHVG